MTVGTPSWLNATAGDPTYNALALRAIDTMYTTYGGGNLRARPGVRPGGTSARVTVSGMTWTVDTGIVSVDGSSAGVFGEYRVPILTAETGAIPARDATWDRKDIIVARVYDKDAGDASATGAVEYIQGTAASSPSAPTPPPKSTLLATLTVPKASPGSPISVADGRQLTVAAGGVLPTPTRPATADSYPGMVIYRLDTGNVERFNGTSWDDLLGAAWNTYNPSWRNGSGGALLSVGNGTIEGRYQKRGKTIEGTIEFVRGSTTNAGSDYYAFSVPETPRAFRTLLGGGVVVRGGNAYPVTVQGIGGVQFALVDAGKPGNRIAYNNPTGWATGDYISIWFQYEVN